MAYPERYDADPDPTFYIDADQNPIFTVQYLTGSRYLLTIFLGNVNTFLLGDRLAPQI